MLDFSKNYFELFGLPKAFDVDSASLQERYHSLQSALHPDRFAAASDREKRLSMQASTRVNEAFATLVDPLRRARYLLSLHTGDREPDTQTTQDTVFLMEQMELRENLAEVKGQSDPIAAVGAILDRLAAQSNAIIEQLTACFETPEPDLLEAGELVRKLQFVTKCRGEAENLEEELDHGCITSL